MSNKYHGWNKNSRVVPLMIAFLVFTAVIATAVGAVYVPVMDTARIILKNLGIFNTGSFIASQESIIFFVRFPRVIVAILVGAALSTSGCVMQGMFRNPMADPGVIGVSSGAGLGAVIAISLGLTARSIYFMPLFAIAGAFTTACVIYFLASKEGKLPILSLILSGIAISTFTGAVTSLIITRMRHDQINEYLFWSVGSLGGTRWENVNLIVLPIIICIIILNLYAKDLNVLLLGEEEAHSVGLNPSAARKRLLFFVSTATAMAVCVSGSISFIGLIVPHIMRLIVGPNNRILLPASAVAGAIFLVGCDLISRIVIMPSEIGVGIVTALLGAPYFLFLLNKARKEGVAL